MSEANGDVRDLLERLGHVPREHVAACIALLASRLLAEPPPEPKVETGDRLLSAAEVAEVLAIDPATVSRRRFPFAVKIPHLRELRYSQDGLSNWLREHGKRG